MRDKKPPPSTPPPQIDIRLTYLDYYRITKFQLEKTLNYTLRHKERKREKRRAIEKMDKKNQPKC